MVGERSANEVFADEARNANRAANRGKHEWKYEHDTLQLPVSKLSSIEYRAADALGLISIDSHYLNAEAFRTASHGSP